MSQKSDSKMIAIAISFAMNQTSFRRVGIQRRPIWPVRLPLVTALLGLPLELRVCDAHGIENHALEIRQSGIIV